MNDVSSPQSSAKQGRHLNVGLAILVGQCVVNLPVLIIILAVSSIGIVLIILLRVIFSSLPAWIFHLGVMFSVVVGGLVGWLWWSFSVPRWRRWALQRGVPADQLQKWAVMTGLVWPKGWIFEKTEFRVKE